MTEADDRGPSIDPAEELYRAITVRDWWLADPENPRPRSAAFKWPKFSVNIASLMSLDEAERHLRDVLKSPEGGLVAFHCGDARQLGFDPRHEQDEAFPDNDAHGHVYSDGGSSQRMRRAKRLAELHCRIAIAPSFTATSDED